MLANLTNALDFQTKALVLRAERQRVIASNIANGDTPGYVGRALDFKAALQDAVSGAEFGQRLAPSSPATADARTHARHIPLPMASEDPRARHLAYTIQSQPSMDGNGVDLDQERSNFVDNAVRYEATLRFINGSARTLLSAIQGQ